jgi:hypothetical protein
MDHFEKLSIEHDLYKNKRNIEVCTDFEILKSQSTYHFSHHSGSLATEGGTIALLGFIYKCYNVRGTKMANDPNSEACR